MVSAPAVYLWGKVGATHSEKNSGYGGLLLAPLHRPTHTGGGGGTLVVVGRKYWAYGARIDVFLEDRFDPQARII